MCLPWGSGGEDWGRLAWGCGAEEWFFGELAAWSVACGAGGKPPRFMRPLFSSVPFPGGISEPRLSACQPECWLAGRLLGLPAWVARWLAGRPACRPASQPSACPPVGLHASWLGCRPAGPLACWPGCLAACLPGCLLSQSTYSQHPVNIQSTSNQHPVNMRRETNETINIFYTAEEEAGVAIPASLMYY